MKVSVIVPVFNTEKYVEKCILSLMNQTLGDLEAVIVNDGSNDGSRKILEDLKLRYPNRIQLFHKENGGQATARNMALQYCKGDYIGFLDSDDYVKPDMFEKMYKKAIKQKADYVACGYQDTTFKDGQEIILKEYVASKVAKDKKDLFFGALVSPFLHLYKRELILENKIVFPEGVIYEDTAFYLNLIPYIKNIGVVEEALAVRVRHSNSTMTISKKEKVAQIFSVLQNSIDFFNKNNFMLEYKKELEYFCTRILLCSSMERISKIPSYKEGWELVLKTYKFLRRNFPEYKKNPFLKGGLTHLYMRIFGRKTAWIIYPLFRIKVKLERKYE